MSLDQFLLQYKCALICQSLQNADLHIRNKIQHSIWVRLAIKVPGNQISGSNYFDKQELLFVVILERELYITLNVAAVGLCHCWVHTLVQFFDYISSIKLR